MIEILGSYVDVYRQFRNPNGRRFLVGESNRDCNRNCSYCNVCAGYNPKTELTVAERLEVIDWAYGQGYRTFSTLGGETLAPFLTKEKKTFAQTNLEVVKHAKQKGMIVNVTTNGDYIDPVEQKMMEALRDAGLDTLTLSLHTYTKSGLQHLIDVARLASRDRIIPAVQLIMTSKTTNQLPGIAAYVAQNGILCTIGVVQTRGDSFAKKQNDSVIPTLEQQKETFRAFRVLQRFGFVATDRHYLKDAVKYYPNNWRCDPERDNFLRIGADGEIRVCSRVGTGLYYRDLISLDNDKWRENKRAGVKTCGNCLYNCYYEAQNPDILGDIPTIAVGLAIKSGGASLVEKWGQIASRISQRLVPDVNWQLQLT